MTRPAARALALLLGLASPALADAERELHWRNLDVEARLDARGTLHVTERQVMVFTGDWNGGERRFRVEPGQSLRFESLTRLEGEGLTRPLVEGDLDGVDHYRFTDGTALRWRTRRPSDPPYRATELTFVLRYSLAKVVVAGEGGGYRLAHDFAFPDRDGRIERVTARLALDPAWSADPGASLALEVRDLPPGAGAVLQVALRFVGSGAPEAWVPPPPPEPPPPFEERWRLPLVLFAASLLVAAHGFVRRDAALRGLLGPLPGPVNGPWLAEHVWALSPEVVGAAWDDAVGSPEVSAVLARMTAEGKLEVRVTSRLAGLLRTVHMKLKLGRKSLQGHERALVDGLFPRGDETDSASIRDHYRTRGFDPATRISGELKRRVRALYGRERKDLPAGPDERPPRGARWLAGLLLVAGVALAVLGILRDDHPLLVFLPAVAGMFLAVLGHSTAAKLSRAVEGRGVLLAATALPLLLWLGLVLWLAWAGELEGSPAGLYAVCAHALLFGAGVVSVTAAARSRLGPGEVAVRRRLAAARRHLARELAKPAPDLDDAAVPYLIALGLARGLDRWLEVHLPAASATGVSSLGGATSRSTGGSGAWTGGGGAFSGGGASGTWSALSSVAASVPAPSSDSSGSSSSSSSGSSSGGGGGGGW